MDFSDSQSNKLLFMLLSVSVTGEVKWERGSRGHNISKFSELEEDKLGGSGRQIKW